MVAHAVFQLVSPAQAGINARASSTLLDVPVGAQISDGKHSVTVSKAGCSVDVSRWQIDRLRLEVPQPTFLSTSILQKTLLPRHLRLMTRLPAATGTQRQTQRLLLQAVLPDDARGIYLQGLPGGAVLSDGVHALQSRGEVELFDLTGWQVDKLTVQPLRGQHEAIQLRVRLGNLSEQEREQLGELKIRLVTPNAYVISDKSGTQSQPSLPKMEIVVGRLAEERRHSPVRIKAAPGRTSAASIATDMHAQMQGFKVLDDEELEALERKIRS